LIVITVIKDEEALWRELSIVKNLHHPNIVEFYEHFEDADSYYLVMELVEVRLLYTVVRACMVGMCACTHMCTPPHCVHVWEYTSSSLSRHWVPLLRSKDWRSESERTEAP
jgi:serine/threonine protein kinase